MTVQLHEENGIRIAEVVSDELLISSLQEGLDILADVYYQDVDRMILHAKNIIPVFFDLKTGVAGEILQKFSNYRMRLAIIGDFSQYPAESVTAFITESNRHGRISFVGSLEEAKVRLGGL